MPLLAAAGWRIVERSLNPRGYRQGSSHGGERDRPAISGNGSGRAESRRRFDHIVDAEIATGDPAQVAAVRSTRQRFGRVDLNIAFGEEPEIAHVENPHPP